MLAARVSSSGSRPYRLTGTASPPLTSKTSPYVSLIIQLFRECANCLVPLVNREVSAAIGPEYFGAAFVHYKWLRVPRDQLFTKLLSALESNPVRLAARFHAGRLAVPCC